MTPQPRLAERHAEHHTLLEPYHILVAENEQHGREVGAHLARSYGSPVHVRLTRGEELLMLDRAASMQTSLYVLHGAAEGDVEKLLRMRPGGILFDSKQHA